MKKSLVLIFVLLTGCVPKVDSYCNSLGLAKTSPEYGNCTAYYTKMDNWFTGDLNACQSKAAQSFPEYMYDHPRYADTQVIDHFGRVRTGTTLIEPDYIRNQSLDNERRKIIVPCMAQHGWKSPDSWQPGRIGGPALGTQF